MAEFQTPVDIGNRALQHCGAEMMDAVAGFTEVSKAARQVSFVYGKLRRSELERNVWTFATRRVALRAVDNNTMLLVPSLWVSTANYFAGSIVSDGLGTNWVSRIQNNLNNQPNNTSVWEPYFGPMTVTLYDSKQSYYAGELVYTAVGDGTYRVYSSLISANSDVPATATTWSSTATYFKTDVVTSSAISYMSLIDLNINQTPSASPAAWAIGTTYALGNSVAGSDGVKYTSIAGGNLGNDPTSTAGFWTNTGVLVAWTTVFTASSGSMNWLEVGGAEFPLGVGLTTLNITYPIGAGPSWQDQTRNIYRLPSGYLREANQNPKEGSTSYLGAPTNSLYNDWLFEGDYIISSFVSFSNIIVFRFVADIQDVSRMKSMFCEGLAARIASEICEPMTQSTAKVGAITQAYNKVMGEARTVNAIEAGSEEPPLDDYLACRG